MAGLLDFLIAERGRGQYNQLEQSYRQAPDPNALPIGNTPQELDQSVLQQQGGYRQPTGLLGSGPPPEFYLRAGGIAGYQQLAQQAQVGQQAMERQNQNQVWESQNISLAQKLTMESQNQQRQWENQRREYEYATPSSYQQASIEQGRANTRIAAGNLAINQQQLEMQRQNAGLVQQQAQLERQFPALALKGKDAIDFRNTLSKADRAAEIATDTLQYLDTNAVGQKALNRGEVNAMRASYEQNIIPIMATMVGTGTIQQGDMDFIKTVIGEPGAWVSMDSNQRQKVASILQTVKDFRGGLYGMAGAQAPAVKPGSSAWARSRGSVEPPADIKWAP